MKRFTGFRFIQDMILVSKEFLKLIEFYFPNFYDVKYLNLFSGNFIGGLNKLAEKLQIWRIGKVHQAGSDSILTLGVFEKLRRVYFQGVIDENFKGILFGLNDIQYENNFSKNSYIEEDISNLFNK
jgi:CCR4-NOT transcription complex subunit 7/8